MNAFESLVSMLLRREGYWTIPSFKVELEKEEKKKIGRASAPRWEIDIVAYKGSTGEVLAVECKSYINSGGVDFRNGGLTPATRYKMFTEPALREVVLDRLKTQLIDSELCPKDIQVKLAMATGNIKVKSQKNSSEEHDEMRSYFEKEGWVLFDDNWICNALTALKDSDYEDDIAFYTAKLVLHKNKK